MPEDDQITANFTGEAADALRKLCKLSGGSMLDAIRRAIGTELYLRERIADGARVSIQERNGDVRALVLK